MKYSLRNLKREASFIRMNASKKSEMKNALAQFMEAYPVRIEPTQRHILRDKAINYLFMNHMKLLYAAFIVLLGGGGLVTIAEASYPGDMLYPVKVHVNEKVASALKFSDASRAKWEVERIERRLVESDKLQLEGKLNGDAQEQVDKLIAEHVNSVRGLVDKLTLAGDKIGRAACRERV